MRQQKISQMKSFLATLILIFAAASVAAATANKSALYYADQLLHEGKYKEALPYCEQAVKQFPKAARAWKDRGVAYENLDEHEKAIADLTKAISLNHRYAVAYSFRAWAYNELRDYAKSIQDCTEALKINPYLDSAYANRSEAFNGLHKYSSALADANMAIKLTPQYAVAYNTRAWANIGLGNYTMAVNDASIAIRLSSKYRWAYYLTRAQAYEKLGEKHLAKKDRQTAKELMPEAVAEEKAEEGNKVADDGPDHKTESKANEKDDKN